MEFNKKKEEIITVKYTHVFYIYLTFYFVAFLLLFYCVFRFFSFSALNSEFSVIHDNFNYFCHANVIIVNIEYSCGLKYEHWMLSIMSVLLKQQYDDDNNRSELYWHLSKHLMIVRIHTYTHTHTANVSITWNIELLRLLQFVRHASWWRFI